LSSESSQDWLVRYNGRLIKSEEFQEYLDAQLKRNPDLELTPATRRTMLEKFVERKLLVTEAEKMQVDREPDFRRALQEYREQMLIKELLVRKCGDFASQIKVTNGDMQRLYKEMGQTIRYRYLLVADVSTAQKLLIKWRQGELPPGLVDTGMVRLSSLEEPWKEELQKLPAKEPCLIQVGRQPVLVEIMQRGQKAKPPLNEVKTELENEVIEQKKVQFIKNWINELKQKSHIQYNTSY
jgi:hypothetical protein